MHRSDLSLFVLCLVSSIIPIDAMNRSVLLWNGEKLHHTTYTQLGHDMAAPLEKRANPCKGSTFCKSCCAFRKFEDMCDDARGNLNDDWIYQNGYSRSGACATNGASMGCGVFVHKADKRQDVSCVMRGRDIKAKYDEIRSLGCKRCGRVPVEPEGCEVKVDYVTDCH